MKRQAGTARDDQRLEVARLHLRTRRGGEVEEQIHPTAEQVLISRLRATVRHMHQFNPSQIPQGSGQHMLSRATAPRGVGEFFGVGLGMRDQLAQVIEGQVLARHQGVAVGHGQAHGLEVAQTVVRQIRIQARVQGQIGDRAHQEGVPVGCRLGDQLGAHQRAGAGAVFHHGPRTQSFAQAIGQQPPHHIKAAARRLRHHHPQRLAREGLGPGRSGRQPTQETQGQGLVESALVHHESLLKV